MASKTNEIIYKTQKNCAANYLPVPVVLVRGEGVWVWDVEGKEYMDMLSCYSAVNCGHAHPEILAVLAEQAMFLTNCSRAYFTEPLADFAELLGRVCGMDKMLPMNTGAEAVETAIKLARKWGYQKKGVEKNRAEIIVCDNNFHGRTTTIIGFSSEEQYRDGFGPFTPGFVSIPYGNAEILRDAITENTVAFLVEPIQGEAGIIVPPEGYLRRAREVCDAWDVLFIADEIQTGLGRTGRRFACEYEHVRPDVYILGKALGAGVMPVSAVVANEPVMEVFEPGDHGSTFGGGPLASALATTYLDIMEKEQYAKQASRLGSYFISKLRKIKSPHIKEVRGRGLLIGVELNKDARPFCEKLAQNGVLSKETHDTVLRFAPPLVIEADEIDWALERIKKVLT